MLLEHFQSLGPIACRFYAKASLLQKPPAHVENRFLVINEEHKVLSATRIRQLGPLHFGPLFFSDCYWKQHSERRAFTRFGVDANRAGVPAHNPEHGGQAKAA